MMNFMFWTIGVGNHLGVTYLRIKFVLLGIKDDRLCHLFQLMGFLREYYWYIQEPWGQFECFFSSISLWWSLLSCDNVSSFFDDDFWPEEYFCFLVSLRARNTLFSIFWVMGIVNFQNYQLNSQHIFFLSPSSI